MVTFPIDLFLADSDLEPLRLRLDEFFKGLTEWSPASNEFGLQFQPPHIVEAETEDKTFKNRSICTILILVTPI